MKIRDSGDDAGVASATARTLAFYAAKSGDKAAQQLAKELLDRMWAKHRDKLGVSTPETRVDYKRFDDPVYVPPGWHGQDAERRSDRVRRDVHSASGRSTRAIPTGPRWRRT